VVVRDGTTAGDGARVIPARGSFNPSSVGGITASVGAAFLWATYYAFLLLLPGVSPLVLTVLPFLVGALGFFALLAFRGAPPHSWLEGWARPGTLFRGGLLLALQVDVVLATRITGAVDTSLATLLGDVLITPLLVSAHFGTGMERLRWPSFQAGIGLSTAGAVLAIVGGGAVAGLRPEGALLLVPLPLFVGVYFASVARRAEREPMPRLVAQASATATLLGLPVGFVLGGSWFSAAGLTTGSLAVLGVMGITSFFVAPWAYFYAASRLSLVVPAVLQALIPVFTLLLVVAFHFGSVDPYAWVGVPLAFVGGVLAVREPPGR
jgi:drug/metabolite transporter (DMT)-like permease